MDEPGSLISVDNVSFRYGTDLVLDSISLDVRRGDFLALIGPNGSGKSTLIKCILGLLQPSQGTIRLMGQDIRDFNQWHKVGYIPQKATELDSLFPASVREIVAMGLLAGKKFPRFLGASDAKAVDDALELVGMETFTGRKIGAMSGGQQQRVFIARALASGPSALILDEPTAGVDASTQTQFYDMLDRINREKEITLVLVTHDISVVTKHVRQVACLNQNLIFHGSHEEFCSSMQATRLFGPDAHIVCHSH